MTAMQGISPLWTGAILALAVGIGVVRLSLWNRSAPVDQRAAPLRVALLALLQILAGVLLFLTLHSPLAASRDTTLVVATRGAGSPAVLSGEVLVSLPEAGAIAGAERVPELATAIRRHPQVARLRIIGEGLPERDRAALSLPVQSARPPPIPGIVEIALPAPVAPGAAFTVGGRIGVLRSGTVELVDPGGTIVARAPVAAGRRFVLKGAVRAEGIAVFELRLRDAAGRLIERLDSPVHARADPPPRVMALAGAPGPEVNFLGRWAEDAGVDLTVGIDLGAGVRLGQAPSRLSAADLARTDLLIIDDRSWERLDVGARGLVARAVEGGMGLLLRPTSALATGTRRDWALLGAPIAGDGAARPLALPDVEGVPDLGRWNMAQLSPDTVSEVLAPDGSPLASWRARGQGRIGVWTVRDSYVLALAGRPDAHADLWSKVFSTLSRPIPLDRPRLRGLARVGERAVVCGVTARDEAHASAGQLVLLQIDHRSGPESCGGFWPAQPGWAFVGSPGGPVTPLYVHPASAAPSLRAHEAAIPPQNHRREPPINSRGPLVPSPSLLSAVLLSLFGGLWLIERRRSTGSRDGRLRPKHGSETNTPNDS